MEYNSPIKNMAYWKGKNGNGISPVKDNDELRTRGIDKDGNKVIRGSNVNKDQVVSTGSYQLKNGKGSEGDLVKVTDNRVQDNKEKPGNFKGMSFDTFIKSKQ